MIEDRRTLQQLVDEFACKTIDDEWAVVPNEDQNGRYWDVVDYGKVFDRRDYESGVVCRGKTLGDAIRRALDLWSNSNPPAKT